MTSGPKQLYLQEKGELERELKKESTTEKRKEQILKRLMRINEFLGTANIQGAEKTLAGVNPEDSDAVADAKMKSVSELNRGFDEPLDKTRDRQTTEAVNQAKQATEIINELSALERDGDLTKEEIEKYDNAVKQFNDAKEALKKLYPCSSANETGAKGTSLEGASCGELFKA